VLEEEGMYDNALKMGEIFQSEMGDLPDIVTEVRGRGLFWGMVIQQREGGQLILISWHHIIISAYHMTSSQSGCSKAIM